MPSSGDIGTLWEACPTKWRDAQRAVWHSTKRVMESEKKVQRYWEMVEESLPIGSEEAERANRLSWDSYWQRVEVWEALKKNASKWNHQGQYSLTGINKRDLSV